MPKIWSFARSIMFSPANGDLPSPSASTLAQWLGCDTKNLTIGVPSDSIRRNRVLTWRKFVLSYDSLHTACSIMMLSAYCSTEREGRDNN